MKVIPKSIHHLLDDSKGGIKKSYLEENYYDKDYIDDNFVSEADVSNFVTIQGPLQTVLGEKKLKNISLLNIPGTAPSSSDIDSGKSYLYSSYGSYAEVPGGGGGGGGETLTILRNGTQVATYNGSTPVSANILVPTTVASLSDASDYATKAWVENKGYITSAALSGYVTIDTDQEITGAKYFSNALAIPLSAPSSPTSGLSYLYAGSGSYAEEPGGGVADVYPLTITKNGSSWLYYDPGEEAVSVNLFVPTKVSDLTNDTGFITSSALTGYATQTWVEGKGYITSSALNGYVNDFEVTGSGNAVTTGSKSGSKITLTKDNTFVDLTSEQLITGAKKHANVALLNIPTSISSSDIESGKVYLYSGSGEYAEEASGGVADVYPLYLVIGGTTTTYDPASESTTVTFGSAAKKGYTTSITQGSADLPTSDAVYSAIAAAVTSALHYRGMSSTALTDGGTETATIGGVALVPQSGDVVIYGGFEFLWENSVWNKLGDDSSYALKTIQITAGTGLTGGGDLTSSRTISLSSATIASLGLADSALQSSDMKALTLKVGTATIGSDYNALAAKTYTISKTNITDTIGSTTYAPYHADGYLPLSAGSGKALTGDLYFDSSSAAKYIKYKKSSTTMNAITMAKNGDIVIGSEDLQNTTNGTISFCSNQIGFLWGPTNDAEYLYLSGSYITTNASLGSPNDRIYRAYLEKLDAATSIETAGTLSVGGVSTFTGKLLPSATNATDIGSSSKYFKDGYLYGWLYVTNIGHPNDTLGTMGTSFHRWSQIYATNTNSNIVRANDLLGIPTSAPQSGSVVSGEAYLYSSTGSYAETPGGGVADVYPLTITKNGSAWLYYNPGTQAESINLVVPTALSDLTADSTHRLVTDTEKATWNAKYDKPSGGIPGTDLATAYLPLTGGTISGNLEIAHSSDSKITLKSGDADNYNLIKFVANDDSVQGYLGTRGTTDLKWNNYVIYNRNNLFLSTLVGSSAIGSTSKPVYYNGSSLVACGTSLTDYLPLTGGTMDSSATVTFPVNATIVKNISFTTTTGWARNAFEYRIDGTSKFQIGAYGSYTANANDNGIVYAFIGCENNYGSTTNLRFYPNGDITIGTNKVLHAGNYNSYALPLTGGTLTGPLIVASTTAGNFNEGIRLTRASNSWVGITFGSTGTSGIATDGWFAATNPNKQFIIAAGDSTSTSGLCLNKAGDAKWRDNVIYHAGNLTKSVLTTLLDSNSGYYLPLTGGSLTNASFGGSLTINRNSTGGDSVICYKANTTVYGYMGIRANNTPVFYSGTDINTVNTILHSGNYSTWAVPRKDGVRFYPYIGTNSSASFGAQWFKVTLSHNGQAAGANRWYMLSMDLVINSAYSTSNPPTPIKGTVHLQYYFSYNNSQGVYSAGIVKGMFTGMNYPSLQIKYDPANPAIFYVKANGGTNIYNTLSIENMMANDSAANIDYSTTTIVGIAEADIPSTATSEVPIDSYLPLTAGSSYPLTGDLYLNASSHRYIKYIDNASTPVTHNAITMYNNGNLVLGEGNRALGNTTYVEGGNIQLVFNNSEDRRIILGANYMRPDVDNQLILGTSSYRWNTVYAAAVSASTYYGTLYDFVYLTNHPYNVDDAAVKGVNFHYANAGTKPTGSQDGSAFTLAYSSAWVTQMYGDWRTNKFYTRVKTNGTWGDWAELATTKGTVEGLNTSTETDATFVHRAVPSVAVGDVARVTKVKGKTIVWNQMITNPHFTDGSNWSALGTLSISGNVARVTGNGTCTLYPTSSITTLANHIYYAWAYVRVSSSAATARISGPYVATEPTTNSTTFVKLTVIGSRTNDYVGNLPRIYTTGLPDANSYFEVKDFNVIDLTKMFGAGNEPSTVAEFEALYPEVFYSYNTGELVSNKAESIETIGFNLWDEEWENGTFGITGGKLVKVEYNSVIRSKNLIPVFPNSGYSVTIPDNKAYVVGVEDEEGNGAILLARETNSFTTQANTRFIVFSTYTSYPSTYNHDICINLSDTTKNGTYEPYRKDNLPLNITKLKVDTTNLWDEQWEQGTLDTNGADYASTINIRNKGYIPVEGGKTYYVNGNIQIYEYGASKNYITRTFLNSGTITLNVNTCYLRWRSADNYTYTEGDIWINTPDKRPSLKLNQLAKAYDSSDWSVLTYTTKSTDSTTEEIVVTSSNSSSAVKGVKLNNVTFVSGHKYYINATFTSGANVGFYQSNGSYVVRTTLSGVGVIGQATSSVSYFGCRLPNGATSGSSYRFKNIVCIDLTEMYGAGLEPTSAAEVEELVGIYHSYTEGECMPYHVFPKGLKGAGTAYDEASGKKAIKRIGVVDLGTLSWSKTTNSNIDVGYYFEGSVPSGIKGATLNRVCSKYAMCLVLGLTNIVNTYGSAVNKITFAANNSYVYVIDSTYTDAATFQAAMAGVKLYYELATPIEYDLETAVPELIECDVLGTQRRLPEDTASSVQAPFRCDFQYGANPGEIVSDSSYRYLPLAGGTVYGTLEASGELIIPDHAPYQPEPNKHYLYVNDNGNYYQS